MVRGHSPMPARPISSVCRAGFGGPSVRGPGAGPGAGPGVGQCPEPRGSRRGSRRAATRPLRSAAPRPAPPQPLRSWGRQDEELRPQLLPGHPLLVLPLASFPIGFSENLCTSSPNSAWPGSPVGASPSHQCSPLRGEGLPSLGEGPRAGGGRVLRVRARKQPGRKGSCLGTPGKGRLCPYS